MPTNIELKAKVGDFESFIEKLKFLNHSQIFQEDFYVNVNNGRLKLRKSSLNNPQLISYERENSFNAKESHYKVYTYSSKEEFSLAFKNFRKNFGFNSIVKKKREYYRFEDIRIHLDEVENLGKFVEIELVINDLKNIIQEREKASSFFHDFLGIPTKDLVDKSYSDLI
ncbi:class IV adenylate cyclase [Saccharicrinis sp. FJH2]|uniref:class IV adenylate cyclase n=1 Tax=Saccharicrinis sp. FJH65 TaxID=3344659 RepID=UPI0035F36BB6